MRGRLRARPRAACRPYPRWRRTRVRTGGRRAAPAAGRCRCGPHGHASAHAAAAPPHPLASCQNLSPRNSSPPSSETPRGGTCIVVPRRDAASPPGGRRCRHRRSASVRALRLARRARPRRRGVLARRRAAAAALAPLYRHIWPSGGRTIRHCGLAPSPPVAVLSAVAIVPRRGGVGMGYHHRRPPRCHRHRLLLQIIEKRVGEGGEGRAMGRRVAHARPVATPQPPRPTSPNAPPHRSKYFHAPPAVAGRRRRRCCCCCCAPPLFPREQARIPNAAKAPPPPPPPTPPAHHPHPPPPHPPTKGTGVTGGRRGGGLGQGGQEGGMAALRRQVAEHHCRPRRSRGQAGVHAASPDRGAGGGRGERRRGRGRAGGGARGGGAAPNILAVRGEGARAGRRATARGGKKRTRRRGGASHLVRRVTIDGRSRSGGASAVLARRRRCVELPAAWELAAEARGAGGGAPSLARGRA